MLLTSLKSIVWYWLQGLQPTDKRKRQAALPLAFGQLPGGVGASKQLYVHNTGKALPGTSADAASIAPARDV
jgi:hypothetical protein